MDRSIASDIRKELADAQKRAAEGRAHIAHQREVIEILGRDGHDTAQAKELLDTLLETQALHEESVERLMKELQTSNAAAGRPGG
jgi:hypothetical protein